MDGLKKGLTKIGVPVLLLLAATAAVYIWTQRKAVILTDPVWRSIYLAQTTQERKIKSVLLRHLYLPMVNEVPLDSSREAIEKLAAEQGAAILMLSPLLAARLGSVAVEGEWVIPVFVDRDGSDPGEMKSSIKLVLDWRQLSEVLEGQLIGELESENYRRLYLLHSDESTHEKEIAGKLMMTFEEQVVGAEASYFTSEKKLEELEEIDGSLFVVLPGFLCEYPDGLDLLDRRGASVVVVGYSSAYPGYGETVVRQVQPDLAGSVDLLLSSMNGGGEESIFSLYFRPVQKK